MRRLTGSVVTCCVAASLGVVACEAVLGLGDLHAVSQATDDAGSAREDSGSWCTTNGADASFCEDFDEPAFGSGWDELYRTPGADGGLDPTLFHSSPYGFTAESFGDGGGEGAFLEWNGPASPQTARIAFDTYFAAVDVSSSTALSIVQFSLLGDNTSFTDTNYFGINLDLDLKGLYLTVRLPPPDGGPPAFVAESTLGNPPVNEWVRLELVVTLTGDAGEGSASVFMNGQLQGAATAFDSAAAFGAPWFWIGTMGQTAPIPRQVAHIDNVVIDVH